MTSGAIASAIANPTDVLKVTQTFSKNTFWIERDWGLLLWQVRMQSASDAAYTRRTSCAKFFKEIYREEGVHGLYRVSHWDWVLLHYTVSLSPLLSPSPKGVVPTAHRAMVVAGVLLPSYDFFKDRFLLSGYFSDTTFTHFWWVQSWHHYIFPYSPPFFSFPVSFSPFLSFPLSFFLSSASFLAGLMGTAASNPIDVIKVSLQNYIWYHSVDIIHWLQSRMMNQKVTHGNAQVHIYTNSLDCLLIVSSISIAWLILISNSFLTHPLIKNN